MRNFICILLVTLMVAGSLTGCATAEFQVSSITVTPSPVVAGEPIVAEADVSNIGGAEGVYAANLTLDGEVVEVQSITIAAGTTETISFTCYLEDAGSHVVGLGGVTETVIALKPAEFEIASLRIVPPEVAVGEEAVVEADIENIGEVEGTCPVILKVNGVEVETEDIMVAAGGSKAVSFQLAEDEPGMHTIDLQGLTGALKVLRPAEFKVSNLRITPEEVKVGGEATLEADIENIGEVEGTCPVILQVNGVEVETKDIMVAAGGSKAVSFHLTEDDPGMYTIDLEGLTGEVHFRELKPAEFELAGDILIEPNLVKVEEEASITITIRNVGEAEGTYTASLVVDEFEEQTMDITLTGGVEKSINFWVSKDSPGSYSVEIGDREAVLEVFEPVRLRTGTKIVNEMRYGYPKIEITENKLLDDAVIVLCSSEEPYIPILAVYIRSGDTPTIKPIQKGTYAIYVTTGQDWDDNLKKFYTFATYRQFIRSSGPLGPTPEFEFEQTGSEYTFYRIPLELSRGEIWSTRGITKAQFPELE